jgi:LmbE family N-acetylglucosaminyl deacetylase
MARKRSECGTLSGMVWIYLSPHLDDVALSCGGLVKEQTLSGYKAQVWTICAGDPPAQGVSGFAESLHERWQIDQEPGDLRRNEDIVSCLALGAVYRHFAIPDCIYRLGPANTPQAGLPLYTSEESLWQPPHEAENGLLVELTQELRLALPPGCQVVCPLTLGGHVDHRLTRLAAENAAPSLWYYADYPYALNSKEALDELRQAGWLETTFPISEAGLAGWIQSIAEHRSQISTFWHQDSGRRIPAMDLMKESVRRYCEMQGGVRLWHAPG